MSAGAHPEDAGPRDRLDPGRERPPGVLHDAPDAGTAHPSGESDVEHLHERVAARGRGGRLHVRARGERAPSGRSGEYPTGQGAGGRNRQDPRLQRAIVPRGALQRVRGSPQERLRGGPPCPPGQGRPWRPSTRPTSPRTERRRSVCDDRAAYAGGRAATALRPGDRAMSFRQAFWDEPLITEKRSAPDEPVDLADLVPAKIRRERPADPKPPGDPGARPFPPPPHMNLCNDTGGL